MGNINRKGNLFLLIMFIAIDVLSAQTLDFQTIPNNKKQFGFSFKKAFYSTNRNTTTLSGVYELSANIPLSSKLNIIGNIPYINTSYDIDYGFGQYSYSESFLGNIFIGLQTKPQIMENRISSFTFGLLLPTTSERAALSGALSDYYYYPTYFQSRIGLYFNYAYHYINTEGLNYGLELGPNLLVATEINSATELFVHYGITGGYQINKLLLNVEVIGFASITSDVKNFDDRFINMFNIGAHWMGKTLTPIIFYKVYLRNEIRHNIDGVLSLGVNVLIE